MQILTKGRVYLATIVENNTPKKYIVKACGYQLVKIILTGLVVPAYRCGSIKEVQSC